MGRFFTKDDIPNRKKFPYGNPINWDWHIGDFEKNFSYRFIWYEEDDIFRERETKIINKVELRRWCERELNGDVYISPGDQTKLKYYNPDKEWEGSYQVTARWTVFYFELDSDIMAFKLRWW